MPKDDASDQLRSALEAVYSCRARPVQTTPARETFRGQTVWEGIVHVFDLNGHPTAIRA